MRLNKVMPAVEEAAHSFLYSGSCIYFTICRPETIGPDDQKQRMLDIFKPERLPA